MVKYEFFLDHNLKDLFTSNTKKKPSYHLPITAIKMGSGFNRMDPIDFKMIILHPQVMEIFRNHQQLGFFELLNSFYEEIY